MPPTDKTSAPAAPTTDEQRSPAGQDGQGAGDAAAPEQERTEGIQNPAAHAASQEAARYRTQLREAEAKLAEIAAQAETDRQARLAEQGEWRALADERASALAEAERQRAAFRETVSARLVDARLRSALAGAGVTDATQQEMALAFLRPRVSLQVGDDLEVSGEIGDALDMARAAFGLDKEPAAAPTKAAGVHPAAQILSQQLPRSGDAGPPARTPREALRRSAAKYLK